MLNESERYRVTTHGLLLKGANVFLETNHLYLN
jgi:hypothetical protein